MYEDFLQEKRFIVNVSVNTLTWYEQALAWLPNPNPTEAQLKQVVVTMRERGLSARSVNSYRTALNSYLAWAGSPLRIPRMKQPVKVLPTYSQADVTAFMRYKPKHYCGRRLQTIILMMADTGCRITELLTLRWQDVNFNDLLVTVRGKGDRQRTIPYSLELRKHLFRLQQQSKHDRVFATRDGNMLNRRNVLRDVKLLAKKLGVRVPERGLHAWRHTAAIHALRNGASVFHVMRQLGHADLSSTRHYLNLTTDDLQSIHSKISLLS